MRALRITLKWFFAITLMVVFLFAILVVLSRIKPFEKMPFIGGYKPMVVLGGSMEPTIKIGSVVVVASVNPGSIAEGDVITFKTPKVNGLQMTQKDSLTTHRVVGIDNRGASKSYTTKGDANKTNDNWAITEKDVLGKTVFSVPYLGYFSNYVKTPIGFLVFLVLPGLIIIILEIRNIVKELRPVQAVANAKETG